MLVQRPELPKGPAGSGKGGSALDWRGNQPSEPGLRSAVVPSAGSFLATPRSQSVLEDFALPKHCDDGGSHMRKSFVALALLVGAVAMLTTSALAQEGTAGDQGVKLHNARISQVQLSRAARLRTSADSDTFFIGHMASGSVTSDNPFVIGVGTYRPGLNSDGLWDFDSYNLAGSPAKATVDSMQGWTPIVRPNARTSGTKTDANRPWFCLDWGNRLNATPVQGRTVGIIGVWHADGGGKVGAIGQVLSASPMWNPLAGDKSAWCGLRAGKDVAVLDDVSRGGTGNPINGDCLWGEYWNATNYTAKLFPGYAHRWDQMLYRDVRVASGANLEVSFLYQTHMDPRLDNTAATCAGWFNLDPLSMTQGGSPVNFISTSATTGRTAPIDSFMVYVGVPTDPEAVQYSDGGETRIMYDKQRRWFSEVLKIDAPYIEILSTWGRDSVYKSSSNPFSRTISSSALAPLLAAQGAGDGGGVIRIVFRSKTNKNYGDESGTGGSYNSGTQGAVRIDNVVVTSNSTQLLSSGFETAAEINNTVEGENTDTPGPAVGEGYALGFWHATGKPPKLYAHTHPIYGGDIGGGNVYAPLTWNDICGKPNSPIRQCNVKGVVVSTGDHDNNEAAGGGAGTPFRENVNGMMSPTINLITPESGVNNMGIDRYHAETTDDWYVRYDQYAGIFDIYADGNIWGHWQYNYPAVQANGAVVWGDCINPSSVWYNTDKQCYWTDADVSPLIKTSNPSGLPDSIKLVILREQRCISFGVTDGCSPTGGHYIDNVTFMLPPHLAGAADKIEVDIWDWYNDAFPANETPGLPGNAAAFDTCAAHIFTGYNIAPNTNDELRFTVPGDSVYISTTNATIDDARVDIVFRIYPGPGNYVTRGNRGSGLRQVPALTAAAVSGDGSFWGQYMASPGLFSKGTHSGGWNVNTWNSVRIDTVERNIFPVDARTMNLSGIQPDYYQTTMHDAEPKLATLGILKNRCFLIDTSSTGLLTSSNITCSYVPAWASATSGYNSQPQTREFTKVFPDGLLTPGSHVEYFIRMSKIGSEADFVAAPDTNRISPQPWEGPNYDGHRWQEFSILPDRWKATEYGGPGGACMLVVDANDRRGDERAFVGLADSIGLTKSNKYGAHNGWHCTAAYVAPGDGSHNFSNETDCGTNPAIAIWSHGGQPGTLWDMYQVKASESASTGAARMGGRIGNRAGMGYLAGKEDRHGPTPEMLRTYYKMVLWMSGDLNTTVLGPDANIGQDDVGLLEDFLSYNADKDAPRAFWAIGNGFVQSEDWKDTWVHTEFVTNYLGVSLRDASYFAIQGQASAIKQTDLTPTSVITTGGEVYSTTNTCLWTNDVLRVNSGVEGATPASYYEPIGANYPYVAGVYAPSNDGHPYITLVDGFDFNTLFSHGSDNTVGRLQYFMNVLVNTFGSICAFEPELTVDVPTNTVRNVDFLGNVWGNPMVAGGKATVHFGLAKADRVEIKVYDVTGRLVKSLANRNFNAGEHTLVWDGTNDQGRTVSRGVYFTQVKFIGSRFVDAKKVTVLK
jgi:hypothetical protein